jgi:hypothetical protein
MTRPKYILLLSATYFSTKTRWCGTVPFVLLMVSCGLTVHTECIVVFPLQHWLGVCTIKLVIYILGLTCSSIWLCVTPAIHTAFLDNFRCQLNAVTEHCSLVVTLTFFFFFFYMLEYWPRGKLPWFNLSCQENLHSLQFVTHISSITCTYSIFFWIF